MHYACKSAGVQLGILFAVSNLRQIVESGGCGA